MHRRGAFLYVGDIGAAGPPHHPGAPSPLDMVRLGIPLLDVANVEGLAAVCAELARYSFLVTIAPPRIHGLTGIPVTRSPSSDVAL
jgi:hypothetical protein